MAERLGEALLDLRTNDTAFNAGIQQAEGRAQKLGAQLDRTSGSSAKLATEMVTTGRSAAQMGAGFEQAGQQVVSSAGAQRQGMQQLSFQIGDIATMYSLGARPAQIFASQIGQVTQAVQMMSGGTSRAAAFLGGPWGIALTAATIVLAPFIGKLFEAEDALKGVEFASDKLGDAQGILGSVIDKTTGQINTQSAALLALARAQAAAGRIGAMERQAQAGRTLNDIRKGEVSMFGPGGFTRPTRVGDGTEDVVTNFQQGRVGASFAIGSLESRLKGRQISPEAFARAAQAITNFEVEGANVKVFEQLQSALNGDTAAARRVFGPQGGPRARNGGASAGPRARSEGAIASDFADQSLSIERQALQAKLQLATSADDRAAIQEQLLDMEREQRIAEVEASDLGRARKDALIAQIEALLGTAPAIDEQGNLILSANRGIEGQIITRERMIQIERDTEALAQEQFNAAAGALQLQLQLADTDAERKAIALQLLEAEDAHLRSRLDAVILSETANEAEQQRAQVARDALDAAAGTRRAAVGRQNETEMERYMRTINATPGMINEALEGIQIDGLEALNDGLTDAIMGAESLGAVFKRVSDQIIADLLRIALQQAIVRPLANAIFGGIIGGGGPTDLLSQSSLFAGGRATGGTIPTGQFAIVGEEGPELAFAGPGGMGIMSNPASRALMKGGGGRGTTVSIPISIDATGADAAAIARVNAKLDELRSELPGRIVSTVQEARDRRVL